MTAFFLLAWLPYFLALYPGTVFYDELLAMKNPYETANQPLFYGYLLNFVWNAGIFLGDETLGFAIFIVLRMAIIALSFSYLICFLYERGIGKKFLCLASLVFAFFPIFPNNAITIQKDGINACFILLLTIFLYQYKDKISDIFTEKKPFFILLLLTVLIVLMRSNGIHAMLFMLVVFWYLEKTVRLRIFFYILLISAIAIIPNRGRHTPFEETVGVPLQQVGRTVYTNGNIKESERIILQNVMDFDKWRKSYVC